MGSLPLPFGSVSAAITPREEVEFAYELSRLPEGWLAVGGLALAIGLCWLIVWMYRREGRIGAGPRLRTWLAVIRCAVILTLMVIWLEPVRVRYIRRWIDSYTVVLVDTSSSMDLADTYRDADAAARVKALLNTADLAPTRRMRLVDEVLGSANNLFLRSLADNNRVKLYTFSDEPELQALVRRSSERAPTVSSTAAGSTHLIDAAIAPTDFAAHGSATNIDRSLRRAVESLGGAPVAAAIVLSDGGFNQGLSAESAARYAADRDLPVYVVGIGDPSAPRNIRIAEVLAPQSAFKQDPFAITVRLASEGLDGQTIPVELRERNASSGGAGRLVDRKIVTIAEGGRIDPIVFERRPRRVGRYTYSVEVPVQEDESVADDNVKQVTVSVIDARVRVLLVAGGPSWEYRFVSRLLERDDTFDLSCWLQTADYRAVRDGNTIIDHMPRTPEELFQYDAVILMDPNREEFDREWCVLVDKLVTEYGGGLLFTAARPNTPDFMRERELRPLINLLPITLNPESDLILNRLGHYQHAPSVFDIPETVFDHPVLRLAGDPVSTKLRWRGMGGVYWHFPVEREKPVATVLMRHGDSRMRNAAGGHVLAAVQFVGAGRSGFIAFDGTWRWRSVDPEIFDRFWVQLVRFLVEGKLLGGMTRATLLTEGDQFAVGDAVTVTARLLDPRYEPLDRDEVTAKCEIDDESFDFTLRARADRPGWFEGRFVPDRAGNYRIVLRFASGGGDGPVEVAREVRVARPNIEILRPRMDRASLVVLAEQSAGGRYFEVDEAASLPGLIPDRHEETTIKSRPMMLWDNAIVLALLVTLLAVEWGLRKWNRLL